jgi:hypothetical protein
VRAIRLCDRKSQGHGTLALNDDFAVLRVQVDLSNVKGAGATFSAAWQAN